MSALVLGVVLAGMGVSATLANDLPPAAASVEALPAPRLPASLRGTPIEQALGQQDWERAEQLLAGEIERAPDRTDLLVLLARVFMVDRKPLNAAIAIKKAEALGPLDGETRFTLALAYIAMERVDWAGPELERLAASSPTNVVYQYWLGRLDYDAGRYASAIARLEQVVAREPGFIRGHDSLGLSYEAMHQPDRAIPHYRRAVSLNREASSKSPWPALNLATLLRQRGELDEAETLLREALGYDLAFAQAHYQLGMLLEQRDQFDEAAAQLMRAVAHDPAYAAPHYALARIYRRLGRLAEAGEALEAFQRLREASR